MQPLDPLTLKLHGQILIEASAGTGKTYTIGLLFLRLLLEQNLSVDEILVVTFTKAATEELRGRVRLRIREALDELEQPGQGDKLLQELMAQITDRSRAIILLTDALTRMDEAAIFTIHGFCQRMLQEYAFESDAPFEMEFLETEQLLRNRIIEDFWRLRFYPSTAEEASWASSLWNSPQDLLKNLSGHLSRPEVECVPVVGSDEIGEQLAAVEPLFARVQALWQQCRLEVAEILQNNKRLSREKIKNYGQPRLDNALNSLDRFVMASTMPWLMEKELELFTTSKIESSLKKTGKTDPPEHPFFHLFTPFFSAHQAMTRNKRFHVLLAARKYLLGELAKRKEEQSQLYFNDLLTQLDASLQNTGGKQLAASISKRFPMIMVDEFQDTDPLQYRIFSGIHASSNQGAGLFLIGDPKQAIYSFRGADIFTYLQARRDTLPENRFTMTTNYRSTTSMVAAVNQLFNRKNSFCFDSSEMDFLPVTAADITDDKPLRINGQALPALTCLLLPEGDKKKPLGKKKAAEHASCFCAHEIAELLAAGITGKAQIDGEPLQAGDIAVLVRTHAEADIIRTHLNALKITSVYYSQDSVFTSKEADQLLVVLSSLLDPADSALVRSALATDLFGYDGQQLYRLRNDELQWEQVMDTMNDYQQTWYQQGFTPMFQHILADQQVVHRLHSATNGERMLTNFLHLAELLQEADQHQHGTEGLLRWLNDQIQAPEQQADNQQLRLESDENLVKIVTIHKAKGLEYPVTFLPFLWAARPCNPREPLAFHRPEQPTQLLVDLGTGNEEHFQLAEQERLADDLRLLYVAITRARYSCYFCWGNIKRMGESGLHYLLHRQGIPDEVTLTADLDSLSTPGSPVLFKPYPEKFSPPDLHDTDDERPLTVARFKGHIDTSWQITSYSRLTAHSDPQPERPDYDELLDVQPTVPGHNVFGFPKGADAGTCLHAILENIKFRDSGDNKELISTQLALAGFDYSWVPVVDSWMQAILATELEPGFSLSRLEEVDKISEMSFYFPLTSMNLQRFNKVLKKFTFAPLPDLPSTLQGLLVGFIDLVYRHNGRYYIVDYKSNYLGNQSEDYNAKKLQAAMVAHRYDLQYLIYTIALHRFLAHRIPEYGYETHMGGVFYLFLRGMNPKYTPGTGIFGTRPPLALIEKLSRCCAGLEGN